MLRLGLVVLVVAFAIYLISNVLVARVALEKAQATFNERVSLIERVTTE